MESTDDLRQQFVSLKLFYFLSDQVVGTEKIVKYRRLCYKVFDSIETDKIYTHISSGSKAEGLDLPGSDTDVMFCDKTLVVSESSRTDNSYLRNTLFMCNTKPGFVHILVPPHIRLRSNMTIDTYYGRLISNRNFKAFFLDQINKSLPSGSKLSIHGPCLSTKREIYDVAVCFRCKSWPSIAKRWMERSRLNAGWPLEETVSKISEHGVLLVPIGSKSLGEDNHLEWRISFSEPEKLLIHSFNHSQFLCYALLKLVLKQIINKGNENNILCSYFLKTAVFWLSEEIPMSKWKPENLLIRFWNCIDRLYYWLQHDYIPNYFIPEHNMISGKVSNESRVKITFKIKCLKIIGWASLTECQTLRDFMKMDIQFLSRRCDIFQYERGCIPLLFDMRHEQCNTKQGIANQLMKCITYFSTLKEVPLQCRKLYGIYFAKLMLASISLIGDPNHKRTVTKTRHSNKMIYRQQRNMLSRILIGSNVDAASGWVSIAMLFYCTKQYLTCLEILEYISALFDMKPVYVQDIEHLSPWLKEFSFFKRIRHGVIKPLNVRFVDTTCPFFYNEDFMPRFTEGIPFVIWSTSFMSHYLRFLCNFRLHREIDWMTTRFNLIQTIEDGHMGDYSNSIVRAHSLTCLYKAAFLVNDMETAVKLCSYIQSSVGAAFTL